MKVDQIELHNTQMVYVLEEIYGLRYSGDRWVLGVILGNCDVTETEIEIVECELVDANTGDGIFEITVDKPRQITMTNKAFDRLVAIVAAYRDGTLE